MSIEISCLVGSAILCLALPLFYVALYNKQVGFAGISGTREISQSRPGQPAVVAAHTTILSKISCLSLLRLPRHISRASLIALPSMAH
jgi:hypothetical protein